MSLANTVFHPAASSPSRISPIPAKYSAAVKTGRADIPDQTKPPRHPQAPDRESATRPVVPASTSPVPSGKSPRIAPPSPQTLLAYLRDCLAGERARAGIPSIFSSRVRAKRVLTGRETVAFSEFASLDLPPSELAPLVNAATLSQRDTDLFLTTLILASFENGRTIHTPVLLYPIEIENSGLLQPDHSRVSVNPALAALFELPPDFENRILGLLPRGEINSATPGLIARELASAIPDLDATPLDSFPNLLPSARLAKFPVDGRAALLPASVIILAEKSKNVAGLLRELAALESQPPDAFPPALLAMLGQEIPPAEISKPPDRDFAPAFLNPSQARVLRSALVNPLTVCDGPPGTGKSFTIAAIALDHVARSQSVLIACRSDEAAAVLEEMLAALMPGTPLVVRAGRRKHLGELKSRLDQLLGSHAADPGEFPETSVRPDRIDREISAAETTLAKRVRAETAIGHLFEIPPRTLMEKFRCWRHKFRITRAPLMLEMVRNIGFLHRQRLQNLRRFNAAAHRERMRKHLRSPRSRDVLKRYREALGRRAPASQERELLDLDLTTLLHFLPIWITTTDDIHRVLPLRSGVFDLVVIDEATQLDLASGLPILQRGRRALITGDPRQLRHISFLSNDRLRALAEKHRLPPEAANAFDFRRVSFLDRAIRATAGTDALVFLDEHFRSLPGLISFSNRHFYRDSLRCMREPETLAALAGFSPFTLHRNAGVRGRNGVNEAEIDTALATLRGILQETETSTEAAPSIGFLSPFRAQVDAFQARFQTDLAPADQQRLLRDHQLIAGTAHSFQGAERDIMLLSLALDPASPAAVRRFLERPDVFNVSITRARHRIHLFHSIEAADLPPDSLLVRYLIHAASPSAGPRRSTATPVVHPAGLLPSLTATGWQTAATATTIAGMPIDILLQNGGRHLALDLVGTSDDFGHVVSIRKSLLLQRAGLELLPVSLAEWEFRRESLMKSITQEVKP